MENSEFTKPEWRWLKVALYCFDGALLLPIVAIPLMMWWMYVKEQMFAFHWYGMLVFPLSIAVGLFWRWRRRELRRDMNAAEMGKPLHKGIPHHGMMILIGSQYFLLLGIWGVELWVSITLHMQGGAIAFALAKVFSNFLLVSGVWLMCRMERGYSIVITTMPNAKTQPEIMASTATGVDNEKRDLRVTL